ncbi:hypothetical protein PR001_g29134 [Phytophthora rubi]|uniref:No apical meristem-associated C-terminal domain-containing protein n=1 Tax=Phytophthora rubi TaxID=129364 RepID=A0A6A3H3Z3_9STRA|nr:hypothetical protein PR001_g29134 [Phytophthora rubi]
MPPSRGRNYDASEDLELARAWVHVSTDAATGINQTAEVFWTRVRTCMEESEVIAAAIKADKYDSRSWTSLKSHFGDMSKKVSKFIRCVKKVESLRESGTTERDALLKAQELYHVENNSTSQYQACYVELSECPKFQKLIAANEGTTALPSTSGKGKGAKEANGVKYSKQKRSQEQLQARAVKAQENLSSSMAYKAEVAKTRLRIQEEQALQSMLNELYAVEPRDTEHAEFLHSRRSSLLDRLKAFDTAERSAVVSTNMRISHLCSPLSEECDRTSG